MAHQAQFKWILIPIIGFYLISVSYFKLNISPKIGNEDSSKTLVRSLKKDQTLLTMFTTFKPSNKRYQIYSNVLHNWASFLPQIQPILYTTEKDESLQGLAKKLGWLVIEAPRVTDRKVPYLKEMYFDAEKRVDSIFYGYFNGDLLFDEGLPNTLTLMEKYFDQFPMAMIVGQRTNFPFKGQELFMYSDIAATAKANGKLFITGAVDYFIIARNHFIWEKVPDLVIGRQFVDGFIIGLARTNDVPIIDATTTLLCLHQTDMDGNYAGFKNIDRFTNAKTVGILKVLYYSIFGHTSGTQFLTRYNDGRIELWQRLPEKPFILKTS